jgi:hypothetical protein
MNLGKSALTKREQMAKMIELFFDYCIDSGHPMPGIRSQIMNKYKVGIYPATMACQAANQIGIITSEQALDQAMDNVYGPQSK